MSGPARSRRSAPVSRTSRWAPPSSPRAFAPAATAPAAARGGRTSAPRSTPRPDSRTTELRPGLSVAVVGAGTLGLLAVALLRLTSPARLALVGTRPDRLALGRELGAGETCDLRAEDPVERLGGDFDLVFEAASRPEGAATAVALARRGGTVVLEGISGAGRPTIDPDLIVLGHLRVQGIFGASRAAWRWVVELFASGQLDPTPLVTHRFPLEDFETAFSLLRDRAAGALKVELLPGGGV
jgi:L-iditol 2-dehydrogenase